MILFNLFNFPVQTEVEQLPPIPAGGLEPTGTRPLVKKTTSTASTFITPQVLAAYPLASGIVAAFWKAAQRLLHLPADSLWVCFSIAMAVALFSFLISMSDPKLQATRREKLIGIGFAVINGFYLFTTAIGISVAVNK
jgi:hypothetical protein